MTHDDSFTPEQMTRYLNDALFHTFVHTLIYMMHQMPELTMDDLVLAARMARYQTHLTGDTP